MITQIQPILQEGLKNAYNEPYSKIDVVINLFNKINQHYEIRGWFELTGFLGSEIAEGTFNITLDEELNITHLEILDE